MCENQTDKDFVIPDNIIPYFNTAQAVYAFMTGGLTDLQSRYIFKKILEDAYEIANMYPIHEAVGFLLEIINSLPNCIKTEDKNRLIESLNLRGIQICVKTGDEIQFTHKSLTQSQQQLPPIEHLVQEFKLFDKNIYKDEGFFPNFELWKRLSKHIKNDDISAFLKQSVPDLERNCFYRMEYMIGYQKWNNEYVKVENDDMLTDYDKLYFRWYCLGEIMDVILDIIFSASNLELSKLIYFKLLIACKKDINLGKIVQERYAQICKIRKYPQTTIFYVSEISKSTHSEPPRGLGQISILKKSTNQGYMDDGQIEALFWALVLNNHLLAEDNAKFKKIVSNDFIDGPIVWNTQSIHLTAFMNIAYYPNIKNNKSENEADNQTKFIERARCMFLKSKEGSYYRPSSFKNYNGEYRKAYNDMKRIFDDVLDKKY